MACVRFWAFSYQGLTIFMSSHIYVLFGLPFLSTPSLAAPTLAPLLIQSQMFSLQNLNNFVTPKEPPKVFSSSAFSPSFSVLLRLTFLLVCRAYPVWLHLSVASPLYCTTGYVYMRNGKWEIYKCVLQTDFK